MGVIPFVYIDAMMVKVANLSSTAQRTWWLESGL